MKITRARASVSLNAGAPENFVHVGFRLKPSIHKRVKREAEQRNISLAECYGRLLDEATS